MNTFSPVRLQEITKGHWHGDPFHTSIVGFCHDTRLLRPGELFIAQKTESADGHDFLRDALQKGASAAIVETVHDAVPLPQLKVPNALEAFQKIAREHRIQFSGKVIGVTGSCGKTTTKDLITHLLGQDKVHSNYSNWNNLLGVPLTLSSINLASHQYAVVEAGMNKRHEMERLAWMIEPELAIITLIAPAHLEHVGTVNDVAWEKSCLARAVVPSGKVLFPASCLQYESFQNFNGRARVLLREGEPLPKEVPSKQIIRYRAEDLDGQTNLTLMLPEGQEYVYRIPVVSPGMISNFALALTACHLLDVNPESLTENLASWQPTQYRGQTIQEGEQFFYADCYNANPMAMRDAFVAFDKMTQASADRLYVLGCMGELGPESTRLHYEVGHSLRLRGQDKVLVFGKDAQALAQGLWDAGNSGDQINCLADRDQIQPIVSSFKGAIFLKGSKVYRLWDFLPEHEPENILIHA